LQKPIYILGTGLSHNGSAVLLKDGRICVAIEKERITRKKHDGGNDTAAIDYCLEAEGISLNDVALVVQCANFEVPERDRFHGARMFEGSADPPLKSISHHLAHAWSAAGTCSFDECAIMVIDGCGSPFNQCTDLEEGILFPEDLADRSKLGMWCEKDSFYHFDGQKMGSLLKDFSPVERGNGSTVRMQTTQHSIGGFYAAVSHYVFGNLDDVGKLMGLAPYGKPGALNHDAFILENGSLRVSDSWKKALTKPASDYAAFKNDFQYYADIAYWAQQQVETAVTKLFEARLARFPHENVCYTGGVALNAVANARLLNEQVINQLYMEPAAGDNGLALGCAFYGWMEVLGKSRVPHDGSTCFGKTYSAQAIRQALSTAPGNWKVTEPGEEKLIADVAALLAEGKTAGWFQSGCEFGPRALGHRSILAHPGIEGLGDHINANIKFREDFRPFAPAVLPEFASEYFQSGRKSPYMILVDRTKPEYLEQLKNVTHVNGTARVQTVDKSWNNWFYKLLENFRKVSGTGVLLNTSFNKKGMPIVETPGEAIALFAESALDVLVMETILVEKLT